MNFMIVSVRRGFSEISRIFDICKEFDAVICGGYVRYIASPKQRPIKANDVDIFSKDVESYNQLLKKVIDMGSTIIHENNISVTMKLNGYPTLQLIKPVKEGAIVAVGEMEDILNNFDFTVVRCGLISSTEIMADIDFLKDERKHILHIKNIHCPISSMLRCMKYSRKGYYIKPMEVLKLFADWDNRNDEYRERLYDFFERSSDHLSWKEIDELEALLRID